MILDGKEYKVHPLSIIGRAKFLSDTIRDNAFEQAESLDNSGGKDLAKAKRQYREIERVSDLNLHHHFEPGEAGFMASARFDWGVVLWCAVSLAPEPDQYRELIPKLEAIGKSDPDTLGRMFAEVGIASGFFKPAEPEKSAPSNTGSPNSCDSYANDSATPPKSAAA